MRFTVPSTSHEYPLLSWWAAHASGADDVALVGEESGHRPVWGLRPSAPPVRTRLGGRTVTASATVESPGAVGLMDAAARLEHLHLELPEGCPWDRVAAEAARAYSEAFGPRGVQVWYTRKHYETVHWKLFGSLPPRPVDSVLLRGGLQRKLLEDARRFAREDTQKEYVRRGRPYKRVYCLHGPPGTGKSSLVFALAGELGRPLAIFNVDSLRDDTFIELLSERPEGAMLLFEDVDALFRERSKGGGGEAGMTFSTLLNSLDGVLHPRGAIVFLTTNHLERLDAALRRPGRVDLLVEVPGLSAEQAGEMWAAAFPRAAPLPLAVAQSLEARGVSPAQLSERLFALRERGAEEAAREVAALGRPRLGRRRKE